MNVRQKGESSRKVERSKQKRKKEKRRRIKQQIKVQVPKWETVGITKSTS